VRGLLGLHHLGGGLAGHELGAAAFCQVAGELGVPIILELSDLIGCPALWHADQGVGDRAPTDTVKLSPPSANTSAKTSATLLPLPVTSPKAAE
jgi:hypothetical protein